MERNCLREAYRELKNGNSTDIVFGTEYGEVTRRFCPKERLIILGGGHVALPLAKISAMLDFQIIVVDDRPAFANTERFFMADQVICDEFVHAINTLHLTTEDYVCILTRGHRYDAECLRAVLAGSLPCYVGMLGSKRRVTAMKEGMIREGYAKEILEQIHTPIGLDIHALTTAEIAVSITGEMIANRRKDKKRLIEFEAECLVQTNIDKGLFEIAATSAEPMVLALVTQTKGSTPVKSGAMMLVGPLGILAGTIGGGCKEAEVIQIARELAGTGKEQMVSLNLLSDFEEEEGMACGGTMMVWLTDLRDSERDIYV